MVPSVAPGEWTVPVFLKTPAILFNFTITELRQVLTKCTYLFWLFLTKDREIMQKQKSITTKCLLHLCKVCVSPPRITDNIYFRNVYYIFVKSAFLLLGLQIIYTLEMFITSL